MERTLNKTTLQAIAFIGQTLAPFFLKEPGMPELAPSLQSIATIEPTAASQEWPFVSPSVTEGALRTMQLQLAKEGAFEVLGEEYRRLFVGPAKKETPPWGSVYTDRECVVFGESTLALRYWMRSGGIERRGEEKTPEDHFGSMLLLMAWISQHKPELLHEYLEIHLFTWSSHFLTLVEVAAKQPFYQALATLTRSSLEAIQKECDLKVTYPRFYR